MIFTKRKTVFQYFPLLSTDFFQIIFKCSDSVTQFNPVRDFLVRVIASSDPKTFGEKLR